MEKSAEAFRTISEVSEILDTPAHVLRFWESRFPQIRPVKRAGGRRYYRPADVALLSGIRKLLHDEGMTIRGVQKILREQGVRHVAALSGAEPEPGGDEFDDLTEGPAAVLLDAEPDPEPMGAIVPFARDPRPASPERPVPERPVPERPTAEPPEPAAQETTTITLPPTARPAPAEEPVVTFDPPKPLLVRSETGPHPFIRPHAASPAPRGIHFPPQPPDTTEASPDVAHLTSSAPSGTESPARAEEEALAPHPALLDSPTAESNPVWTPTLLRALPPGALLRQGAEIARLRLRLLALRDRLTADQASLHG